MHSPKAWSMSPQPIFPASRQRGKNTFSSCFQRVSLIRQLNLFLSRHKSYKGINFYGVLRGVDAKREVLIKIQGIKDFGEITVKVNPLIFRNVSAEAVPAFVYALCATPQMFRSGDCEYRMILYGDLTLMGALEKMADEDNDLEGIYQELKDAF